MSCELHPATSPLSSGVGESAIYTKQFEPVMLAIMEMGAQYITSLKQHLAEAPPEDPVHQCYFAPVLAEGQLDEFQTNINFSNLIFAGVDTTSNALQWMLYHLSQNERVQNKARAEVMEVLGKDGTLDSKTLPKLKYLSYVMKETFRLTPPVFGTARYLCP